MYATSYSYSYNLELLLFLDLRSVIFFLIEDKRWQPCLAQIGCFLFNIQNNSISSFFSWIIILDD
jgi:hypothetical protein